LTMKRATCSRRRQQQLCHREGRRWRRPARRRGCRGDLPRAPTQRAMLGQTRG
jgi:hypothetical protein